MYAVSTLRLRRINPEKATDELLDDPYGGIPGELLVTDERDGIYRYTMATRPGPLGIRIVGAVALLRAGQDPAAGIRLVDHELTLANDEVEANPREAWGAVWLMTPNAALDELLAPQGEPMGNLSDSLGTVHRLEFYRNTAHNDLITKVINSAPLLIADGHHRIRRLGLDGRRTPAIPVFISTLETALACVRPIHRIIHPPEAATTFTHFASRHELRLRTTSTEPVGPCLLWANKEFEVMPHFSSTRGFTEESLADAELASVNYDTADFATSYPELRRRASPTDLGVLCRPPSRDRLLSALNGGRLLPPKTTLFSPKPLDAVVYEHAGTE